MKVSNLFFLILLVVACFLFSIEMKIPKNVHSLTYSDIDQDNDIDIIVGSSMGELSQDTITVLLNDSGNFTATYLPYKSHSDLKSCDINGDGYPELIALLSEADTSGVYNTKYCYYLNDGFGNIEPDSIIFHEPVENNYEDIEIADMDNDGSNDIIFYLPYSDSYWGICYNNGSGQFSENIYYNTDGVITGLSVGEVNNDELPDVLIPGFEPQLFYNNYPIFEETALDSFYTSDVFIEDMDNNGFNDIVLFAHVYINDIPCSMKILYNQRNDIFEESNILYFPCGTIIKNINDFNNDGFPDLICTQGTWDTNNENILIYLNNGNGTFSDPVTYHIGPPQLFKICSADFDDNGFNDIVVSGYFNDELDIALKILFNDGTGAFVDEPQDSVITEVPIIKNWKLEQNYPNPFNPTTEIRYTLSQDANVSIKVYSSNGSVIADLVNASQSVGQHSVIFDASQLSNGIFYYSLVVNGNVVSTKKMLLLK